MSPESLSPQVESYPLRGGRRALTLHASGLRHASSWLGGGEAFVGFDEITDVSLSPRGLKLGTRDNVILLPRRLFLDRSAPERLAHAITGRIGREAGGELQLARMAEIEQLARRRAPLRATWLVIVACLAIHALDVWRGAELQNAGYFGTTLFLAGEWWRILTGNFLHGGLGHLLFNVVGLFALGELVERPLGTSRTALILAGSALGAMGAGAAAGYEDAVGASGMVCGLAGAALLLELQVPERLPAAWRVPRRLFLVALGVDALLSAVLPMVAGAAHFGGFAAGALVAYVLTPPAPSSALVPAWVRGLAVATAVALGATGLILAREVAGGPDVLAKRAERLLSLPGVSPGVLNNTAWMIVTAERPTQAQIDLALRSAQRAVAQTEREDPNFLDTLAESQFLAGRDEDAVETIDEAIALAPGETYFVEQRRRFTGERAYEDRPAPPLESPPLPPDFDDPQPRHPALPPGHPPLDEDPGFSV